LEKEGALIVGIIERDVGIYNSQGFDVNEVNNFKLKRSSLKNYSHAEDIETLDPTYILRKDCDIFAPCANDGTLNQFNADNLKARVVVEGANGPTTFKADQMLEAKGV
jgi:glutamate dehydrogenase (NAD(P)+)